MDKRLLKSLLIAWSFFRLTRVPNLVIIALTQYVTAIFLVHQKEQFLQVLLDHKFFLLVLSTTMIAGAGYIINDYYDTKVDYVNRPDRVIVGRGVSRRYSLATYGALNGLAVLIGLYVSLWIGLIHIFSSLLLWVHSNQLKRLPLMGNFIIGFLAACSLLLVALYYDQLGGLVYAYAFFAFLVNIIREIVKDLEAIKGEEKFGSQALPSVLGIRKTKNFIYGLTIVSSLALTYFLYNVDNQIARIYFLAMIPVFIYFIILLVRADTQRKYAFLSNFANLIMLTGIISILLF